MTNKNKRKLDIESLIEELLDKQKISERGMFAIRNDTIIAPKIQDIIYPRILRSIDDEKLKAIILRVIGSINNKQCNKKIKSGTAFILPLTSTLALVKGDYLAIRNVQSSDKVLFVNHVNVILDLSNHNDAQFYGCSFAICGILSVKEKSVGDKTLLDKYEESVQYLNDFITAYRLMKHDHNVHKITPQTLPGRISYVEVQVCHSQVSIDHKNETFHYHDLMDVRAKLLFASEVVMNTFHVFCEKIPPHPDIRYVLDLFLDSMNEFCLGRYEKCVTDSDLFVEYSTKLIWYKIPNLSKKEMPRTFYSNGKNKSIVTMIARELGVNGNAIIDKWFLKSRKLRNNFIHQMKYSALSDVSTQEAMKYNFEIISLFIKKLNLSKDDPLNLLKICKVLHEQIFEK